MQSFGDLFANNRLLAIGVVLAAIAVILAVGIALFRLVFGRRLHMSGGRTRQPRLGVVDAFDLDRQRQLVLIRRDNVEHLLMIGGPNDVLVEAAIVRVPAAIAGRDKENGFTPSVGIPAPMPPQPTLPAAPMPAAAVLPAAGSEAGPNLPFPAPLPSEPKIVAIPEAPRAAPVAEPAPVPTGAPPPVAIPDTRLPTAGNLGPAAARPATPPSRPLSPMPQRAPVAPVARPATAPTPRANLSRATAATPAAGVASGEARQPGRVEPVAVRGPSEGSIGSDRSQQPVSREPSLPTRFPSRPPRTEDPVSTQAPAETDRPGVPQAGERNGGEEASQLPRSAPPPARPLPTAPGRSLPGRPQNPAPASPAAPPRPPMPSLGSLEEEMAKLLGRPMPPSETPGSGS